MSVEVHFYLTAISCAARERSTRKASKCPDPGLEENGYLLGLLENAVFL